MAEPNPPCGTAPVTQQTWKAVIDAYADLLRSQRDLADALRRTGMITGPAHTAVLAMQDQIDAALAAFRIHHLPHLIGTAGSTGAQREHR